MSMPRLVLSATAVGQRQPRAASRAMPAETQTQGSPSASGSALRFATNGRAAHGRRISPTVARGASGERARVAGGIVGVGPEERDLPPVPGRGRGEQTEL